MLVVFLLLQCTLLTQAAKFYAAGSGSNLFSLQSTADEVIALSGVPNPTVLYLGQWNSAPTITKGSIAAEKAVCSSYQCDLGQVRAPLKPYPSFQLD